jgi:general secretion pathway protein M
MAAQTHPLRAALSSRWAALAPREQRGVQLAATLVGALLVWWLLLAPPLATLKKVESQRRMLDAQLDSMRALQTRAQALQAQAAVSGAESLASLQTSTAALGAGARLQVVGDQATVTLNKVRADALAQWLVQPASSLRLQPAEVHWIRDAAATVAPDTPATWSGTLVFNLPSGNGNR